MSNDAIDVILRLCENIRKAEADPYVRKPFAKALYDTWRFYDENEKPRKLPMDEAFNLPVKAGRKRKASRANGSQLAGNLQKEGQNG